MEQTVEKVKAELEVIAKKLSLPLENPKVILEWCKTLIRKKWQQN